MSIEKDYTTDYWTDLLAQRANDIDTSRLSAWIAAESNGFPQALGTQTEVGIFQIDLQDGPKYGGSLTTLHDAFCAQADDGSRIAKRVRDLSDDEEALQVDAGVAMVRAYMSSAQGKLDGSNLQWSDDDFWCFVKLHHALPALTNILDDAASANQASDWSSFREYTLGLDAQSAATQGNMTLATAQRYMPYDRFFDNGEKVGYIDGGGTLGGGGLSQMGKAIIALLILGAAIKHFGGVHVGLPF